MFAPIDGASSTGDCTHRRRSTAVTHLRRRCRFGLLVAATIAAGLIVHWYGTILPALARDVLGDALWAMMIYWATGAASPTARIGARVAGAVAVCWGVELSQIYHAPWLDHLRATTPGHLVLGSDFSGRDLGAYVVGVLGAAVLEAAVRRSGGA